MINLHINGHIDGSRVATLMFKARDINPMSHRFQRELEVVLAQLEAQRDGLHGVVVGFDGTALTADHELEHLLDLTPAQAGDCMQMLGGYNALLRRIERFGKPVVAAFHGDMSGHVFGLALACHYRFALAGTTVSMPRVRLGLTPSIGAIARMVRLAGLAPMLPLLTEGRQLDAAAAQQAGLLHGVAQSEADMAGHVQRVIASAAPAQQPWDVKAFRIPGGGPHSPALQTPLQLAPALLREKTRGLYPAPEAVLCVMVEGAQVDFDTALLIESRYFCQVLFGTVSKRMMRLHLAVANLEAPPAQAFAAQLTAAYRDELEQLLADGVPEALVRNAALASGMADVPEVLDTPDVRHASGRPADNAHASPVSFADARDRLLYVQAALARRCLAQGMPGAAAEVDAISVRAAGFPACTGGVAAFAGERGYAGRAATLAASYGPRFS